MSDPLPEDHGPQKQGRVELAESKDGEMDHKSEDQPSPGIRDSKGWDGKLRFPKNAVVANPEALSDAEYSDDENVNPGDVIPADEGSPVVFPVWLH